MSVRKKFMRFQRSAKEYTLERVQWEIQWNLCRKIKMVWGSKKKVSVPMGASRRVSGGITERVMLASLGSSRPVP